MGKPMVRALLIQEEIRGFLKLWVINWFYRVARRLALIALPAGWGLVAEHENTLLVDQHYLDESTHLSHLLHNGHNPA